MDDLPLELKQRVCSYLTTKDLKSLRSISTGYAAATDRYFLPRIFLFNHPDSFEEIQIITDNPQLRHSVTTLVVDTSCLPLLKYEKWAKSFVDDKPDPGQPTVTRAERALRREKNHERWTKHQERGMAQRRSRNSMLNSIALAFQKCPRLSNLIIECYGQHNSSLDAETKQNRVYHSEIHPVPVRSGYVNLWRLDSMRLDIWDILKPVHDVDRALSSLVILDNLLTCSRNWTMPTTTIFQNLKHLRHLGSYSDFFKHIVASAPELESIGILGSPHSGETCSLQSLFGKSVPQCLRTCSLNRLGLVEADLVTFLSRHSNTLQSLTIVKETWSYRGTLNWTSFAQRIQGQLPNLRRLNVSELRYQRVQLTAYGWTHAPIITTNDLLQNHAHDLETGPMEAMDGLWEDYENLFFPGEYTS